MSIGALLIGLAAAILVVAYVLVPFRRASAIADVDAQIEAWVAEARQASAASSVAAPAQDAEASPLRPAAVPSVEVAPPADQPAVPVPATETVGAESTPVEAPDGRSANFCHQCGEPVRPHHRFCPNCGARLVES